MILGILFVALAAWFFSTLVKSDVQLRQRFACVNRFIELYEQQTGLRLTYDQALALIEVTVAMMRRDPANKVYLDENYPDAQVVVENLCAEAEKAVWKRRKN